MRSTGFLVGTAKIVLRGCEGFELRGNTIGGLVGARGSKRAQATAPGASVAGIWVSDSRDGVIVDNTVAGLRGGAGGIGGWMIGIGWGPGGGATGIEVEGGATVDVIGNTVRDLRGGDGGVNGQANGDRAGDAQGIAVSGCQECSLSDNDVREITGGATTQADPLVGAAYGVRVADSTLSLLVGHSVGALAAGGADPVAAGVAAGLFLLRVPGVTVDRLLVHHVRAHTAQGLLVEGEGAMSLRRSTLADISGSGDSAGVAVGSGLSATIVDSIVANPGRWAVHSHADNAPAGVQVISSLLWAPDAGDDDVARVTVDAATIRADPLFRNTVGGDYRLLPESPAVDAGALACADEPVCVGGGECVSDLGFFAGTDEALCRDAAAP